MKKVVKASTRKVPGGFKVESHTRSFTLVCDEPLEAGGTDEGMTPVEAFLCSLGSCITIAAFILSRQKEIQLRNFWVDIEGDLEADGFLGLNDAIRKGFSEIRLRLHIESDASAEEAKAFALFVEECCPVSDSISLGVPIVCEEVIVH